MDILEELKYYCNEPQPVGALMLTGEWGCGKTYLLNNILTETLKNTHIILRVSLFGIKSIEEVRNEVKKRWIYAFAESKNSAFKTVKKAEEIGKNLKNVIKTVTEQLSPPIKTITNGVLSLNVIDFVKIEPKIGEKKVVLIFDDLERTNISTSDLLGCINDYCENLHINTIVVANEEKIKSSKDDKIEYNEIKEKIIQRTIHYSSDYSAVVSSVIENMVHKNCDAVSETYKSFLKNNKKGISAIFSGKSVDGISLDQLISEKYSEKLRKEFVNEKERIEKLLKHRPHNIRSLKYAIQDFGRIYCLLDEKQINNKEKWLFTYLSYVLCFRAGLIPENEPYGTLFSNESVPILYPGFYNDKYITKGMVHWVRKGEWNQDTIDAELDYVLHRDKAIEPEEKVRMNELLDLDETDIRDGYPILLKKAYIGEIELNDYVNLLNNRYLARKYNIKLPEIEWNKIHEGIQKKFEKMVQSGEEPPHFHRVIDEDNKEYFLTEEWDVYKIINKLLSKNTLMFERNKNLYVTLIKKKPLDALIKTQNEKFDIFDVEMAKATAEGFKKASNEDKSSFIEYFKSKWQSNILYMEDYKISEKGFQTLRSLLMEFENECKKKSMYISKIHVNEFLKLIDNLIDNLIDKHRLKEIHNEEKKGNE